MQNQEILITYLALVAFSFLGGDVYASAFSQVTSLHQPTPTTNKSDGTVPEVLALETETIIPKVIKDDDIKNLTLMIDQHKPLKDTEFKKKTTINTDKYKNITKYQLTKKDKDDKLIIDKDILDTTTLTIPITTVPSILQTDDTIKTTIISQTFETTTTTSSKTIDESISSTIPSVIENLTELPIDTINDSSTIIISTSSNNQNDSQTTTEDVYSPLLLDGEPVIDLTTTTTTTTTTELPTSQVVMEDENMSRARALNISASEPTNSLQANITDLSDVSMDNDENKEPEGIEYITKHNDTTTMLPITLLPPIICHDVNKTYNPGERIIHGCDEKCICGDDGIIKNCEPICMTPYVRAGKNINTDEFCHEVVVGTDGCCAVLECTDSATEPEESCVFENKTINRGQRVEDGCSRVCICETGGTLKCQPRCPPNETATGMKQHDRCVALPDPRDSCCTITLCDVSLGEHEIKSENISDLTVNLTDVKVINSTAIKLKLSSELSSDAVIEVSEDNHIWVQRKIDINGIVSNLEPAHSYHVRITEGGRTGPSLRVIMPAEVIKTNITDYKIDKNTCNHRGKLYKIGDEWYDECISFCICNNSAKIECATIQCPTEFGLDVLDPTCLDWEPVPSDFIAKAPDCCPKEMRCRNNGSCEYEGSMYENWSTIPKNITGCETTCSCEFGKVNCTPTCPSVTALPPSTLNCPAYQAVLVSLPYHECCKEWICDRTIHKTNGMNTTTAYPGQYLNDMNIHQSTDTTNDTLSNNNMPIDHMIDKNKQELSSTTNDNNMSNLHPVVTEITNNPMKHMNNYNGPYNPDYKPTESSVEEIFHLPERNPEKMAPPLKDKSKTKIDMKKPIEPFKQHKEIIEQQLSPHHYHHQQQQLDDNNNEDDEDNNNDKELPINSQIFPGPISPNKFPINQNYPNGKESDVSHVPSSKYPNKHLIPSKKLNNNNNNNEQQYVPFNNQHDTSLPSFTSFSPNNGESIPPTRFDPNNFDNSDISTSYSKKKTPPVDLYNNNNNNNNNNDDDNIKIKPGHQLPGKIKQNQRKPEQEKLPGDLLNIFQNQHPGLSQLDIPPAQGHPGLYEFHQQITNQKDIPINQISNGFFNHPSSSSSSTPSKKQRPQIIAQENEDGQTTYHIHAPDIQNSQSHLEELLAHISAVEQNSKQGPYQQQYPNRQQINNNYPNGPPPPPPRIENIDSNNGDTYLNHPFAIPTPNQSGNHDNYPPGFPISGHQGFPNQLIGQSSPDEVVIKELEALVPKNVRVVFTVPSILIGLQARFELRYTSNQSNTDPSTWNSQLYLPPNEIISTQKMEVELDNLEIATIYKVKVIVNIRDITNNPSSQIYTVKTYEPPEILIDAELQVEQKNSSLIQMIWRKFSDNETRFIDGVQLRYRLLNASTFVRTPLIHRAITSYIIENLAPSTTYEIGISIIPFPGQKTELKTPKTILVTTTIETNPWAFEIDFEIKTVKSQEVEISWSGIPYPEDRYVNIYRAICKSDRGTEDTSTFKIAKRDSPAKTIINGLKPATRYSLWLMVYLKNGKTLQSNVKDFVTKPGTILSAGIGAQGKLASVQIHDGDYYGPLVIVAIVASLSILSTLILLMMLMKRRTSSKADISPRKTTSAYDNPSYKTCDDAVTITNGHNKVTEHEMSTINSNNADAKESA